MARIPIPFAGGSIISDSLAINNQYSQNWYPVTGSPGAKSQLSLKPTPGLKSLGFNAGVGPVRTPHGIEFLGKLYFVSRNELIEIDSLFSAGTVVGGDTLNTEAGFVDMAASPTELLIVDGTDGWIFDDGYKLNTTPWAATTAYSLGAKRQSTTPDGTFYFEVTTAGTSASSEPFWPTIVEGTVVDGTVTWTARRSLTQITDLDFPAANTCTWLDFYFIVDVNGTGQFQKSNLNDGTAWEALDFATAESVSDNIERVYATTDSLYLIGQKSTEVYWNSGNADFNFEQRSNGVVKVGTDSPWSVSESEAGELVFIARTERGQGDVVKLRGISFSYITDADMSARIQKESDLSNATGWIYSQDGHTFYVLNLTKNNTTICYDFRENFWHDRITFGIDRHAGGAYAYYKGKHVVADHDSSGFYEYDTETYTDNGTNIVRRRRGSVVHKDGLNITVNRLDIEFEAGVGLVTGRGSDPQVAMRYTRNGRIWSSVIKRSIGKIGEYNNRAVWDALGNGRQLTYEITTSDPVKSVMIGAYADIEVGYV